MIIELSFSTKILHFKCNLSLQILVYILLKEKMQLKVENFGVGG